jgi:hypothetical protein
MLLLLWDKGVLGQPGSSIADYRWARKNFRAAEFRGIRMGISKVEDVEKLLGPPAESGKGQEGQLYLGYRGIAPVPGYVEFTADPRSKVVEFMTVGAHSLKISDAIKLFGNRYARLRFSAYSCDPDDGVGYSFFDPNGDAERVVFPDLGIVLYMKSPGGDQVYSVGYHSAWLEPEKNPCEASDRNKKPQGQKRKK